MNEPSFNDALCNIRMSPIVSISELVRKKAPAFKNDTGKDFILFQRGEIDFPTPRYIIDAAKRAMDAGFTKYPKSGGEDVFKDAIISKLRDHNRAPGLTRDNIICTYGGQEGLELLFQLFAGRKGAGFAPCWSCVLENFIPYAGTDFTEVPLESDFRVNFDMLEKTMKGLTFFYLNTPQNPTGKLFTEEEVRRIVDLARAHHVYVISDEAYERVVYDGRTHFSPLSIGADNVISCFTLSKTYSMTGWRLGYLATRNTRITELMTLGNYTQTAGVATFLQHAGKEALDNRAEEEKSLSAMVAEYQKRRDVLFDGLRSIPGISVTKPEGAFYLFPNFTSLIPPALKGEERKLHVFNRLMERGVATVYGGCFGKHFIDNIRISFSTTPVPVIQEGVECIRAAFTA